ncbi:Uncharacterised protein [Vibrio cholerae]|nr:Uncharacterised protein [Vibrio cholerae]
MVPTYSCSPPFCASRKLVECIPPPTGLQIVNRGHVWPMT